MRKSRTSRANVVSSFTVVKGSLIEETYEAFKAWDLSASRTENLRRYQEGGVVAASSQSWLHNTAKVLHRRFDPAGRDRPLVELAQNGCERDVWKPILLYHMTRDEFLVCDFLVHWLYPRYVEGTYRLRTDDVIDYLRTLSKKKDVVWSGSWSENTTSRVASGLLRIAEDFGLLKGKMVREFTSYHLPEESFLYLLHAMVEKKQNAHRVVTSPDWRMYLLSAEDVENEVLRLHQFHKLHYQVAGSLAQLDLPCATSADYARELAL